MRDKVRKLILKSNKHIIYLINISDEHIILFYNKDTHSNRWYRVILNLMGSNMLFLDFIVYFVKAVL